MTALMPERPQTVGNPRLHAAIVEAGLTYEELADDLRVAVKTVERWVNEPGRRPYARHAVAVARVLGVDPWELWPSMSRYNPSQPPHQPQTDSAAASAARTARTALERLEGVDITTASPTEMALHLGALSMTLHTVLELLGETGGAA